MLYYRLVKNVEFNKRTRGTPMSKTLTRADLSNSVYREMGLSLSESTDLVDAVIEEISRALEEGDTVKLSSFGTFKLRSKKTTCGAQS